MKPARTEGKNLSHNKIKKLKQMMLGHYREGNEVSTSTDMEKAILSVIMAESRPNTPIFCPCP